MSVDFFDTFFGSLMGAEAPPVVAPTRRRAVPIQVRPSAMPIEAKAAMEAKVIETPVAEKFDFAGALARYRGGDEAAGEELVRELHPLVLRVVRGHLPRATGEDDLVQDVMVKAFTNLHRYRGEAPLPHWISRLALTTCLDSLRRQRRRPEWRHADLSESEEELLLNRSESHGPAGGPVPASAMQDPAQVLGTRELAEKLLATLSPEDSYIIRALDMEEQSIADLQAATGWSKPMIKGRAFRARLKLRGLAKAWRAAAFDERR